MRRMLISTLAAAFAVAGFAGGASADSACGPGGSFLCKTDDVTGNETWSGTVILEEPIFVKDGGRLTIQPGTTVRGQPRTGPVVAGSQVGTPGTLIVTQTGFITANGGPNPNDVIIFTTAATDNDNDGVADDSNGDGFDDNWQTGETFLDDAPRSQPLAPLDRDGNANVSKWGGVAILGNAPTNLADECGTPYGTCTIEGLTIPGFPVTDATYGGLLPHDNSGSLQFVSIRHAGDEIGEGNELNCLSLGGVGDATILRNVECYANFDDGFEWFGGTVGGAYLHASMIGDDTFDLDQGYTGVNQFLFGISPFFTQTDGGDFGSGSGDKIGEFDGDDLGERGGDANIRLKINSATLNNRAWPFPNPSTWNLTAIGSTPPAGSCAPQTNGPGSLGIQMRNGYDGKLWNSVIVNTAPQRAILIDTGAGDGVTDTITHVNQGTTAVVSSTLDDTGAMGAAENQTLANGDAISAAFGAQPNQVNPALPFGLAQEDVTFDPRGNAAGKLVASLKSGCSGPIDPRPFGAPNTFGGGVTPTIPGLEAVTFRGAFNRLSSVPLWTNGWTVLHIAGLLAD